MRRLVMSSLIFPPVEQAVTAAKCRTLAWGRILLRGIRDGRPRVLSQLGFARAPLPTFPGYQGFVTPAEAAWTYNNSD
jgi:hypothetical protein